MVDEVIDIEPDEVTVGEPKQMVYRFVGNHLTINANHIAYILNIVGLRIRPETYETMPDDIKKHFVLSSAS